MRYYSLILTEEEKQVFLDICRKRMKARGINWAMLAEEMNVPLKTIYKASSPQRSSRFTLAAIANHLQISRRDWEGSENVKEVKGVMLDFEYRLKRKGIKIKDYYKKVLGFSDATFYNRMNNPENMTLKEYKKLVKEADLPDALVIEHIKEQRKTP